MESLNIIGGGANSDLWCQIFADVLNTVIKRVKEPILANLRGTAWLASSALGHISFDDFGPVCIERSAMPRIDSSVVPEALPTPKVEIVGSVKGGGTVETLYMLTAIPITSPLRSIKRFASDPEQIIAWFEYQGFAAGDILTGVWSDVGKQVKLREDPIVVMDKAGTNKFVLRRPVNGWSSGHYLVELKKGKKVLRKAEFQIIE
jgi:hypothetical protein